MCFPPSRWWGYLFGGTPLVADRRRRHVFAVLLHRGKLQPKPVWLSTVPAIILAMYTAWMWLQYPWALDLQEHVSGSSQFAKYLIAFWFVYRIVDTKGARPRCPARTFWAVRCSESSRSRPVAPTDASTESGSRHGPTANTLGMYFAASAIIGLGLLLTERGWRRC